MNGQNITDNKEALVDATIEKLKASTALLKIHDTIVVKSKHKESSWRNGTYRGVVTEISEDLISIKTALNETQEFDLKQDADYTYTFAPISDYEFSNEISKQIAEAEETISRKQKDLEGLKKWKRDYDDSISLTSKLLRLIRLA